MSEGSVSCPLQKASSVSQLSTAKGQAGTRSLCVFDLHAGERGLEVQASCDKHLLLDELEDLYKRMGDRSVLMLFQYRPRLRKRTDIVLETAARLHDKCIDLPLVVAESSVVFFLLTKDNGVRNKVAKVVAEYLEQYPQLRVWNV